MVVLVPIPLAAVSVTTSPVITVVLASSNSSSRIEPVVASIVTAPSAFASTVLTVMSPLEAVIEMSLDALLVVEVTLVTVVLPPVVIVIGPLAVSIAVSVTPLVSARLISPAEVTDTSRLTAVVSTLVVLVPIPLAAVSVTTSPVITVVLASNASSSRIEPVVAVKVTLPATALTVPTVMLPTVF